jgi:hypothetical protein
MLAQFAALLGLTAEAASTGKDLPDTGGSALPELPVELPAVLLAPLPVLTLEQVVPAGVPEAPVAPSVLAAPVLAALPAPPAPQSPTLPHAPIKLVPQISPAPVAPIPLVAAPHFASGLPAVDPAAPAPMGATPQTIAQPLPLSFVQAIPQPVAEPRPAAPQLVMTLPIPVEQQARLPLPVPVQAQIQAAAVFVQQPAPGRHQRVAAVVAAVPDAPKAEVTSPGKPAPVMAEHADLLPHASRTADKQLPATALAAAPVPNPTPLLADPPRAASVDQQAPAVTSTAPAERHDFSAIVDRLTQARELAQPGRAAMQLAHRDFGQVSVQFDMAGPALKVAMTSPDAGFAPAVEAALGERPIAALVESGRADMSRADSIRTDRSRSDSQNPRQDQSAGSSGTASSGPSGQHDSQRGDPHGRQPSARNPAEQVRGNVQPAREADGETAASRARDGNLFA